ncbi:hypothetical protein CORC01_09975 [Colletotrichum orchidophilum]|uniref:Uncharacterized protein n=1 Tax=Colletotrichum orchidophilum TaxID=1209926 RepID=A0A1G4B012_9PEZI|nr:uncharacterized protein CORC01_09975 [Colletotrichum orchidophilum]OHE94758.1 hypothetical protein CORC01_09975 [Colletotrichum orchidophilum]
MPEFMAAPERFSGVKWNAGPPGQGTLWRRANPWASFANQGAVPRVRRSSVDRTRLWLELAPPIIGTGIFSSQSFSHRCLFR